MMVAFAVDENMSGRAKLSRTLTSLKVCGECEKVLANPFSSPISSYVVPLLLLF